MSRKQPPPGPPPGNLLEFPGGVAEQVRLLREIADRCERGEIRFFTVAALESDGSTAFCHSGTCSFIEFVGLIDLAKDTAYKRTEQGF